jgi:hypothetical protein
VWGDAFALLLPFLQRGTYSGVCCKILSSDFVVRFCPQTFSSTFIQPSAKSTRKRVLGTNQRSRAHLIIPLSTGGATTTIVPLRTTGGMARASTSSIAPAKMLPALLLEDTEKHQLLFLRMPYLWLRSRLK